MKAQFEGFAKIYTLTDYDNNPFYVGCTVHSLIDRLKSHLSEAKRNRTYTNVIKNEKIRSLNFRVRIKTLFIVPVGSKGGNRYDAQRSALRIETEWIRKLLSEGFELCNSEREVKRYSVAAV